MKKDKKEGILVQFPKSREYELTEVLPKEFISSLPTIKMIESEFTKTKEKNENY